MRIEEIYLNNIIAEIDRVKQRGGKGVYRINDKIEDCAIDYLKNYFAGNAEYEVNCHKCPTCLGTWDIMISFKG